MGTDKEVVAIYLEFMEKYGMSSEDNRSKFMDELSRNTDKGIIFKQVIREFARLAVDIPEKKTQIMCKADRMIDIIFREYTYSGEWSEDERMEARELLPSKWKDEIMKRVKRKEPRVNTRLEECDEWQTS